MGTAAIQRHYPPRLVIAVATALLTGQCRSLLADMAALAATFRPPLQVNGPAGFAKPGRPEKLLIVFNHYSCPGTPSWWTAIALGGALVHIGLTQPEPRWVMTAAWTHWGMFTPFSRWVLRRLAATYDAFSMPPMPSTPQDAAVCAATVRQAISFARSHPDSRVCLAPEGRDSGDGRLSIPPPGSGRFALHLCRTGMMILPAGVCEDGGAWHVCFGPTFTLAAPDGLSPDARDEWASHRVMRAIADLLPARLRGPFSSTGLS